MKYLEYPLFAEGYINHFITAGTFTEVQQFKKSVLSGRVNEWLKKGFSIHENPCRKEFIAKRATEIPEYMDVSKYILGTSLEVFKQEEKLKVYFPFGNIGFDASGFYYTPTYLRTYAYAEIKTEKEEKVPFEITTCGGMTLWVNDELVTDFIPFTRNIVKHTTLDINLKKGNNKFIICLDDLAERDIDYYFRLRYMGSANLLVLLPVTKDIDTGLVMKTERMLERISFDKEAYISEPVKMNIANFTEKALEMNLIISPGEFIERIEKQEVLVEYRDYILKTGEKSLELLKNSDEILPGYYYFTPTFCIDGIEIKRKIGTQCVRKDFLFHHEETVEERKQVALETVLKYEVDNVYKAAAIYKLKGNYDEAEAIIIEQIEGVRKRKDCSDFHFIIILYLYHTYFHQMSRKLVDIIETVMLGFRYWIDEPGDDVMWFFSENHALLFHICQYLSGEYLPDREFTNSGKMGKEIHERGRQLLDEWFEGFFEEFITEWNSNAYIPVDVLGLGTLYNLTETDPDLHEKAKRALDMVFYALAINEHKGAIMTSFGRTYEKELKGNYNAGTTSLLYVAYNAGFLNRAAMGYLPIILGDYKAPEEYKAYMKLNGSKELIHQNTQGFERHVNLYLYKNEKVLLSTAVGFKPYQNGYQEQIMQATIDETAQVFINHPGESQPYGSGRPNFWAGNGVLPLGVQYRNIGILKYDIDLANRIDYTHAYIPINEFQQYKGDENHIVLEKDGGYIGVTTLNGLVMQEEGPCRYREFISKGRKNVWVVQVAQNTEYDTLDCFYHAFLRTTIKIEDFNEVSVVTENGTEYRINKNDELLINNEKVLSYPLDVIGKLELKGE